MIYYGKGVKLWLATTRHKVSTQTASSDQTGSCWQGRIYEARIPLRIDLLRSSRALDSRKYLGGWRKTVIRGASKVLGKQTNLLPAFMILFLVSVGAQQAGVARILFQIIPGHISLRQSLSFTQQTSQGGLRNSISVWLTHCCHTKSKMYLEISHDVMRTMWPVVTQSVTESCYICHKPRLPSVTRCGAQPWWLVFL